MNNSSFVDLAEILKAFEGSMEDYEEFVKSKHRFNKNVKSYAEVNKDDYKNLYYENLALKKQIEAQKGELNKYKEALLEEREKYKLVSDKLKLFRRTSRITRDTLKVFDGLCEI